MFEKVNPSHPDKLADRIAGAIVDLAYTKHDTPTIACEVLLGHGDCHIILETSESFTKKEIKDIVKRIAGNYKLDLKQVKQNIHLSNNQQGKIRCGDNGIFRGVPLTTEEKELSSIARDIYTNHPYDGKYIIDKDKLVICQSNTEEYELREKFPKAIINPLGYWTGSPEVDSGCTNRKLGSDMGNSVTGGGLHGKDLSKADVSVNIYAFLKAQETNKTIEYSCAIGDESIGGIPYEEVVEVARKFIEKLGGFEKLAEWGLF